MHRLSLFAPRSAGWLVVWKESGKTQGKDSQTRNTRTGRSSTCSLSFSSALSFAGEEARDGFPSAFFIFHPLMGRWGAGCRIFPLLPGSASPDAGKPSGRQAASAEGDPLFLHRGTGPQIRKRKASARSDAPASGAQSGAPGNHPGLALREPNRLEAGKGRSAARRERCGRKGEDSLRDAQARGAERENARRGRHKEEMGLPRRDRRKRKEGRSRRAPISQRGKKFRAPKARLDAQREKDRHAGSVRSAKGKRPGARCASGERRGKRLHARRMQRGMRSRSAENPEEDAPRAGGAGGKIWRTGRRRAKGAQGTGRGAGRSPRFIPGRLPARRRAAQSTGSVPLPRGTVGFLIRFPLSHPPRGDQGKIALPSGAGSFPLRFLPNPHPGKGLRERSKRHSLPPSPSRPHPHRAQRHRAGGLKLRFPSGKGLRPNPALAPGISRRGEHSLEGKGKRRPGRLGSEKARDHKSESLTRWRRDGIAV